MPRTPEIENIEALRRLAGIDDAELHDQVRRLQVGDCVQLTLLPAGRQGAVVRVRITSIRGDAFRGRVVGGPGPPGSAPPWLGVLVAFRPDHIHSVPKGRPGRAY